MKGESEQADKRNATLFDEQLRAANAEKQLIQEEMTRQLGECIRVQNENIELKRLLKDRQAQLQSHELALLQHADTIKKLREEQQEQEERLKEAEEVLAGRRAAQERLQNQLSEHASSVQKLQDLLKTKEEERSERERQLA